MNTAVLWFRDDLRLTDNPTLTAALEAVDEVVPVYVVDPQRRRTSRYGPRKLGAHRARFRLESVRDLRESIRTRGGDLLVREGRPAAVVSELAERVDADAVYAQTKPATEERADTEAVRAALPDGTTFHGHWTHTLYHPDDLPTPVGGIDDTFTPWRHEVEDDASVRDPLEPPESIRTPELESGDVPTLADLGLEEPPSDDRAVLAFEGGETAGKRRVERYLWDRDRLKTYKQTRNGLLGADYSSKFSPWLAAGCLSPRWINREVARYERERVANEDTYWLVFELLWRDFFQFQFAKYGGAFFTETGIRDVEKRWRRDRERFRRWADGETGVPFVDANMRELERTGYLSNRGRQNVASFLVDALEVDWRWGAAHFERHLVDYDVASNWGNWAYQAGVGNDSRDGYFDVLWQADRYDPDAEYVTTWLPELEGLPSEYAHWPWRLDDDESRGYGVEPGVDYPRPMIDVEDRFRELDNR
ncbi:DASH family cryptochrome [Natrarchaeobaculum sulfurireducens]|uniref:Cryptochrome DASH n=1 Tax=Natrarchaeobaculum sulfurireducens TaxID=2044521 RepID=A0A346PEA6_9EURY|nr:DASH family cryptochrome [Natrarchaeobaculum sulfurireducens]AXR77851.1 Deoxyribodipyrimidine photolyase [Natrarchaeobaculum sulfurireducens]